MDAPQVLPPTPAPATLADVLAKLDAVLSEQHELRRLVHRMTVPVEVLTHRQAAGRLGRSERTLHGLAVRGVFSDGRAPGNRVKGAPRLYYADEVEVYRSGGEAGVRRLREEVGRAEVVPQRAKRQRRTA